MQEAVAVTTAIQEEIFNEMGIGIITLLIAYCLTRYVSVLSSSNTTEQINN